MWNFCQQVGNANNRLKRAVVQKAVEDSLEKMFENLELFRKRASMSATLSVCLEMYSQGLKEEGLGFK